MTTCSLNSHTKFFITISKNCPFSGYYADPENCRWFFACLDHGKAPLTAYEFRCPFGLGFDAARLKCDWPWLVPACGNIARYEAEAFGYSGSALNGKNLVHLFSKSRENITRQKEAWTTQAKQATLRKQWR